MIKAPYNSLVFVYIYDKSFCLVSNKVTYTYKCTCLISNLYDISKKRLVFETHFALNNSIYCVL